jgi:hypothetical protein
MVVCKPGPILVKVFRLSAKNAQKYGFSGNIYSSGGKEMAKARLQAGQ